MSGDEFAAGLRAIAQARQAMIDLAVRVRREPGVREASSGMDVRAYAGTFSAGKPLCVDLYVDAELEDGTGRSWWLEVRFDGGGCSIESRQAMHTRAGEDVLAELLPRHPESLDALRQDLAEMVRELVAIPPLSPPAGRR